MARPSGAQCWHWYWYRLTWPWTSATAIGAQPSMIQRESADVGAWIAQATSPREDQYRPVGDSGRTGRTREDSLDDELVTIRGGTQVRPRSYIAGYALRRSMRVKTSSGSRPATEHQTRRLSSWRNHAPKVAE